MPRANRNESSLLKSNQATRFSRLRSLRTLTYFGSLENLGTESYSVVSTRRIPSFRKRCDLHSPSA
jgi:hypothetical protein